MDKTVNDSPNKDAWYRQPLVWMLIAFPLAAVVGGVATLVLAIRSDDGLVADDYYRRGKEIHRLFERDEAARRYGLKADIRLAADQTTVQTILSANGAFAMPVRMQLSFLNATRAGLDRVVIVERAPQDRYVSPLPPLPRGRWYVQLEADDWRLLGELRLPAERQVVIAAPAR